MSTSSLIPTKGNIFKPESRSFLVFLIVFLKKIKQKEVENLCKYFRVCGKNNLRRFLLICAFSVSQ